jgi:hypothetical protein
VVAAAATAIREECTSTNRSNKENEGLRPAKRQRLSPSRYPSPEPAQEERYSDASGHEDDDYNTQSDEDNEDP